MTDFVHVPNPTGLPGLKTAALLMLAIAIGATVGLTDPDLGHTLSQGVDMTLLTLVGLLFFEIRLKFLSKALANLRFIGIAWVANFVIVPVIGYAIASLFLSGQPLLFAGVLIYFLAPCTDWFLAFTRMARGDTALGAALMPINMLTQLILLPLWLWLFTAGSGLVDLATIPDVMLQWFVVPLIVAQVARWVISHVLPDATFDRICDVVGLLIPLVTAALVLQIFAAHTPVIAENFEMFGLVLLAIFVFFVVTYAMGEGLSRVFGLSYPEQALLSMTTAARNAPLMLAVTAVVIPDQPIIYAALVIGMLVEFPHLTVLKQALLARAARQGVTS